MVPVIRISSHRHSQYSVPFQRRETPVREPVGPYRGFCISKLRRAMIIPSARKLTDTELRQIRRQTLWTFSDAHTVGGNWNCKAGFGALVLTGEAKLRKEARGAALVQSSNCAELSAARLGVKAALSAVETPSYYHLVVHTDSAVAQGYLQEHYYNKAYLHDLATEIRALAKPFRSVQFIQLPRATVAFRRCETLARRALYETFAIKTSRLRGISAGANRNKGKPWNPFKEPKDYIQFIALE